MSPCDQVINRSVTQADRADASQRVLQRYSRRRFCRVRAFCSKMSTEFWFLRGVGPPMECRGAAGGVPHFKQLSRLPVLCGSSCAGESYARSFFFSASHCIFTCTHGECSCAFVEHVCGNKFLTGSPSMSATPLVLLGLERK